MKFAHPEFLWLLLPVAAGFVYLVYLKAKDIPSFRFSDIKRASNLPGSRKTPLGVRALGFLRLAALILIVIGLARPQKGLESEETSAKATDIMLVLDASRSMESVDFKPDNRFEVAKQTIAQFIEGRPYDRVGMVLFAEHAVTQCPLTFDKDALLNIVDKLQVGMIPPDQTALGVGLALGVNRLKDSTAKSKTVILVTDGSSNAGNIDPVTAAKTASAFGIKVYAIGAGSPEGGLMPVPDPFGGKRLVKTRNDLDEDTLLKIAGLTDGKYFRAKTPGGLKTIFEEIDELERTEIKKQEFVDYEEYYHLFLIWAVILLAGEFILARTLWRTLP